MRSPLRSLAVSRSRLCLVAAVIAVAACADAVAPSLAPPIPPQVRRPAFAFNWENYPDVADPAEQVTPCPSSGRFKPSPVAALMTVSPLWTSCRQFTTDEKQYLNNEVYPHVFGVPGCEGLAMELYAMVNAIPPRMQVGFGMPHFPYPYDNTYFRGTTHTPDGTFNGIIEPIAIVSYDWVMAGFPGEGIRTIVHEAAHSWAWQNHTGGTEEDAQLAANTCW